MAPTWQGSSSVIQAAFPPNWPHARRALVIRLFADVSRGGGIEMAAGYIHTESGWKKFETEWNRALRTAGVQVFHATDFFNFHGEFKGWDKNLVKHTKFARRFTAIAESNTAGGVGYGVEVEAFDRILAPVLRRYPPSKGGQFTALTFSGIALLQGVARVRVPQDQQIAAIFEQEKGIGLVVEHFNYLKRRGTAWTERFISVTSATKEDFVPLQAADLLAHEAWRRTKEFIQPSGREVRKSFKRLVRGHTINVKVARDVDIQRETPRLLKYLEEG